MGAECCLTEAERTGGRKERKMEESLILFKLFSELRNFYAMAEGACGLVGSLKAKSSIDSYAVSKQKALSTRIQSQRTMLNRFVRSLKAKDAIDAIQAESKRGKPPLLEGCPQKSFDFSAMMTPNNLEQKQSQAGDVAKPLSQLPSQ